MNQLGYAAMVLGNHEFNFGLKNLDHARRDARFPWLSANTVVEPGSRARPFDPYIVRTVGRREGGHRRPHHAGHPRMGRAGALPGLPVRRRAAGGPERGRRAARATCIRTW